MPYTQLYCKYRKCKFIRSSNFVSEDRYKHPDTELVESSKLSTGSPEDHLSGVAKKDSLKGMNLLTI